MDPSILSTDLGDQEPRSLLTRLIQVQEVTRGNEERTKANIIGNTAVNLCLGRRKVWNTTKVLQILGVSEEHHALDLVLDRSAQLRDGIAHHCSTLAVSARHDGRAGALGRSEVEEPLGFVNGAARRAGWKGVLDEAGCVRATDTLDPDVVAAVVFLQLFGDAWPSRCTLSMSVCVVVIQLERELAYHVSSFTRCPSEDENNSRACPAVSCLELVRDSALAGLEQMSLGLRG
jgi:hypothetical protein